MVGPKIGTMKDEEIA